MRSFPCSRRTSSPTSATIARTSRVNPAAMKPQPNMPGAAAQNIPFGIRKSEVWQTA